MTKCLPPASRDKLSRVDIAAAPALRIISELLLVARHAMLLVLGAGRADAKQCDAATCRFSVAMTKGLTLSTVTLLLELSYKVYYAQFSQKVSTQGQ